MKEQIDWHELFASLLRQQLTPLQITVQTEFLVLTERPRGDVLLMRRETDEWTAEQLRYLPDGIRESHASDILIEFKATESLTRKGIRRAAIYDDFYQANQNKPPEAVHTVLISSRKPQPKTLELFQFVATMQSGIYRCENVLADRITLISLNELDADEHNAFVKFFASQRKSRQQAIEVLREAGFETVEKSILSLLKTVWQSRNKEEASNMEKAFIKELEAESDAFLELVIAASPKEKLLARYFSPEERLAGLEPEERLAGLEPQVIEAYLRGLTRKKKDSAENN